MSSESGGPKKKTKKVLVPLDEDLERRAKEKARSHGWSLTSVIRALLGLWVDENVIDPSDVGRAAQSAKRGRKKKSTKVSKDE